MKRLSLNKEIISKVTDVEMNVLKGGASDTMCLKPAIGIGVVAWSGGCTDGCSPIQTAWNCTKENCSADCDKSKDCPGLTDPLVCYPTVTVTCKLH
ncbi:MAG: class I lanthipeptide [Prevotellaceae bacterium]|jgi:hypothetical protein|nr:class I lanthipeptide [Prevotellaceae bacterium]